MSNLELKVGAIASILALMAFVFASSISGGGVSFDGSQVNLNGSNMINGTISNYTTLTFLNLSLNDKVNKSGDTMTGSLNVNGTFVINDTEKSIKQNQPIKFVTNTGYDVTSRVNANDLLYADLLYTNNQNYPSYGLIAFRTISDVGMPYFLGGKANGEIYPNGTARIAEPNLNNILFRFSAHGFDNSSTYGWSGSSGIIDFIAAGNWNETSHPTKIDMYVTDTYGAATKRLEINKNGSIKISNLAGSDTAALPILDTSGTLIRDNLEHIGTGNAYLCFNKTTDDIYVGNPTC